VSAAAVKAYTGELPPYNALWVYMFRRVWTTKCIDLEHLVNPDMWVNVRTGKPGKSPYDSCFAERDLLSGPMLAYFDALVANGPHFNGWTETSIQLCSGDNIDLHEDKAVAKQLAKLLVREYEGAREASAGRVGRAVRRRRLLLDSDGEEAEEVDQG
jgi:hypothetical protein